MLSNVAELCACVNLVRLAMPSSMSYIYIYMYTHSCVIHMLLHGVLPLRPHHQQGIRTHLYIYSDLIADTEDQLKHFRAASLHHRMKHLSHDHLHLHSRSRSHVGQHEKLKRLAARV